MRKAQKKQAEDFVKLLDQAHGEIQRAIAAKENGIAMDLLGQCQEGILELERLIEKTEEEGLVTILYLRDYCRLTFEIYQEMADGAEADPDKAYARLQKSRSVIGNSIRWDVKVKLEIVFLPYKASMWDSLESVWMAADADPACEAYVVPVPYYERNPDGSLGLCHYEGNDLPAYVPVIHYESFHLEKRQPDIIYIHNPYDQGNYVTTVDPRYYSGQLKKYTKLLVYIPYYVTSGNMDEGQSLCQAYYNADYIIVQAEKFKSCFALAIPQEKIQPLGSPKLDKVMALCMNPPEPPEEWKRHIAGKKVYFYNTSIHGMLSDTRRFLLKMEYVFKCFQGREDACLLWRPHPLLEATFVSMRKDYKPVYDQLKQFFMQNNLGIYDDTPDIDKTIALSDAYIGDSGSSVTALFGIAGKPLFLLNNLIHTLPAPDDWRGEIISIFFANGQDEWMVTQGNKLYHSPKGDYCYEFYCDLSQYTTGNYYLRAVKMQGKIFVCPQNAQDILIVSERRIVKKIKLKRYLEQPGAFYNSLSIGKYLFLIPCKYPAIVRCNVETGGLDYIKGRNDIFIKNVQGEWRRGGCCCWNGSLFIASPVNGQVLAIEGETMETKLLTVEAAQDCGCMGMFPYDQGICLLPYTGTRITFWNPGTGAVVSTGEMPEGFQCKNRLSGVPCMELPFNLPAIDQDEVIVPPLRGNMFLSINWKTGDLKEWKPPFDVMEEGKNGYFTAFGMGMFLQRTQTLGEGTFRFFYEIERKLYDINIRTGEYQEIEITFHPQELIEHEPGFGRNSEWLQYGCDEKALYSLKEFLDGTVKGRPFDKTVQIQAYREIAANSDGTCGEKIHQFACTKL